MNQTLSWTSKFNFKLLLLTFTFVCLAADKWPPAYLYSDHYVSNPHRPDCYSIQDGREGPQCAAPNDTVYKRWSCHSGFKLLCKLCRTSRFTVFWACRPCGPAGWLALRLTKAGGVETNPGPTTLNKKVWICDICHKQIHVIFLG